MTEAETRERSVSHLRIGPPSWARLPSDDGPEGIRTYPTITDIDTCALLAFDPDEFPRCRCGWQSVVSARQCILSQIDCVVYDSRGVYSKKIEVASCPECPARFQQHAGPDLNVLGLYNYNNKRVVSHNLLNQFSAMFTRTEVAFDAFADIVGRQYLDAGCAVPFMSPGVFLPTWFGFVRLQAIEHTFECMECGTDPEVLVADGLSAGFDLKQICDTLRPPTTVDE
ncbi:hypothetical protein AURDEDRAFT_71151, partial [Auricularia subglabra TFB-10046 SS5]